LQYTPFREEKGGKSGTAATVDRKSKKVGSEERENI
jgi:hypothetical protein